MDGRLSFYVLHARWQERKQKHTKKPKQNPGINNNYSKKKSGAPPGWSTSVILETTERQRGERMRDAWMEEWRERKEKEGGGKKRGFDVEKLVIKEVPT